MSPISAQIGGSVVAEDGTALATDVYRPADDSGYPAVLLRTYLGKLMHTQEAIGWARRGFACVVQDVRGRYDSDGDWLPYTAERGDGRATVDWLIRQPWCDGRVAVVGGSYGAFAAWSAAVGHPAVRAVISSVPAMRPMVMQPEDGGVLPLLSRVHWWTTHAGGRCAHPGLADAMLKENPGVLRRLPVADLPEALWVDLPGWREAVLATGSDREDPIPDSELAGLDVAALHLGGWHDPFCSETLRLFELSGRALDPRPTRSLVMGPWWHHLNGREPARYGERSYGEASKFPIGRFQADWLRQVLAGSDPADSGLRLFLCGENRWIEADDWSQPAVDATVYFGASGRLDSTRPTREGSASMVYDPEDPHPCRRTPLDERTLPRREDVLVFAGPELEQPCRVVGVPRVSFWWSTEADSVDWVARLLEVTADGRRLYLAHGLVDACRSLEARGDRLRPGARSRVEITLSPLGVTLPTGSRLRLELTNSAFPSYARNLGTGESRLTGRDLRTSWQTVYWGSEMPIRLELPVHVRLDGADRPADRLDRAAVAGTEAGVEVSDGP